MAKMEIIIVLYHGLIVTCYYNLYSQDQKYIIVSHRFIKSKVEIDLLIIDVCQDG